MKFTNIKYFDAFDIDDDNPVTLVIENQILYRNVILNLIEQIETDRGDFVLSDKNSMLSINKNLLLITDVFHIGESSRQIKTKLNQLITAELQYSDYQYKLINDIQQFAINIVNSVDYSISFKEDLTLADLIKMCDFDLDLDYLGFNEKLLEYLRTVYTLLKFKLIVILNIKDVMSVEEYSEFIKQIKYLHLPLLMIEKSIHSEIDDTKFTHIIDSDLCII